MTKVPCSPLEKTSGMVYFARMLEKIRLFAAGELREDLHAHLGKYMDAWCSQFLRIDYAVLKERTLAGGSNEEILEWCFANGRPLNDVDITIWNGFVTKIGWNDNASARLAAVKEAAGLQHRTDIQTMAAFIDADEGRA